MRKFVKILRRGEIDPLVGELQTRLIELGFKKCLVDGIVETLSVDNNFGKVTEGCLEAFQCKVIDAAAIVYAESEIENFQAQYPFSIDGVFNYSDWYILYNYEKLAEWYKVHVKPDEFPVQEPEADLIKKVIDIAKSEIGVTEDKPYNNSGKRVNEYHWLGSCNQVKTGSPWCQYFMNWLLKQLSTDYKWTCSGYTPTNINFAVAKKCGIKKVEPRDIEVGDFGFIYSASRGNARHVFLIIGIDLVNKTVTTIEGNTNNNGSAEGFGVFKRLRPLWQVWAVAKWHRLYEGGAK